MFNSNLHDTLCASQAIEKKVLISSSLNVKWSVPFHDILFAFINEVRGKLCVLNYI